MNDCFYRRRQFILGPPSFPTINGWTTGEIAPGLQLSTHPDLSVCHVSDNTKSLTLLGDILDPRETEATNTEILHQLSRELRPNVQLENFPRFTDRFFGRWVMIVTSPSDILLFGDATGQRQVHYTIRNGSVWCASQADLIAKHLEFAPDPEAVEMRDMVRDIMDEGFHQHFWWPGDKTMFRHIRRLLPNNSINLRSGAVQRFFGQGGNHRSRPLTEVVRTATELLQGAFLSARNRFPIALACSAGWDSRVLMAASQVVRDDVFYFSRKPYYWSRHHPDIAVPKRLLSRANLKHRTVNMPPVMSEEFAQIYRASLETPHENWGVMSEGLLRALPAELRIVTGNISEVCRCFYWDDSTPPEVTPYLLTEKSLLGRSRFTLNAFEQWLSDAQFGKAFHPLDMAYWEQRAGSWAAAMHDELAIAHDAFPLYNCRELLTTMLSVDNKYRRAPNYELYQQLIKHMWPEGLSEPINPPKPPLSPFDKLIDIFKSVVRRSLPDPIVVQLIRLFRYWHGF
ncbi:MAG: hypothetical protein JW829_15000 [Pirellulales bacterium]|nr:hypothetical protein [Pirellulales bacterium]